MKNNKNSKTRFLNPVLWASKQLLNFFVCSTIDEFFLRHMEGSQKYFSGRRGGLVVSALDSGSRGPGSSPGRVIVLCSWARHFTLTVSLSTQEYKWVPAKMLGSYLRWTSIPSRRNSNIPSRLMLQKPG